MEEIEKKYGARLRVRVCGLLLSEEGLLLVKHSGLGQAGELWIPPGGGMEFGTSATDNLRREFREETGLEIRVEEFLFVHEYLNPPLHAVELFFRVRKEGGTLITGYDPEIEEDKQIIQEVKFVSRNEWEAIDKQKLHQALRSANGPENVLEKRGYFKFVNNSLK